MVEVHTFPCKFNQREETLPCLALTEIRLFKNEVDNLRKEVEEHQKKIEEHQTTIDQEKRKKQEFGNAMTEAVQAYIGG